MNLNFTRHLSAAVLVFISQSVLAAEPITPTPDFQGYESFTQMLFGLIVVLVIIFILAGVFKRLNLVNVGGNNLINVVASHALSNKERLVLVQVGDDQILVGMSPGNIRKVHKLTSNVYKESSGPLSEGDTDFTRMLKSVLNKSRIGGRTGHE